MTDIPERTPYGIVWMDLCRRHMAAFRDNNEERRAKIDSVMKFLEDEYPEEISNEKKLWERP